MRTYKFRLSEIIPNAWFYKLKEMGNKTTTTPNKKKHINQTSSSSFSLSTTTAHSDHRKSYHISRDLTAPPKTREPPQKSAKKRHNKPPSPRRVASSVSTTPVTSPETSTSGPDHRSDETLSCGCSNDTTILPSPKLPPIITKTPTKTEKTEEKTGEKTEGKKQRIRPVRRYSGLKLRAKSPTFQGRKSVSSQSFAVVKTSRDPHRDFRESMVEMIVENNIRASKDLEDLLACYLSLNSDEYHDLIIKVFKQIWFDVFMNVRLN